MSKLTQSQLARLAGVSQATISHIEHEQYVPALDTALRIAAALHTPVEKLFILEPHELHPRR